MPRRPVGGQSPGRGGGRGPSDRRQPPARSDGTRRVRRAESATPGTARKAERTQSRRGAKSERGASRPPSGRSGLSLSASVRKFSRRPTGRFTSRAAILALVIVLLLLTLTYPARQYLAQRQEIADLEEAQRKQSDRIGGLEERKEKWSDPAYIKAQARKRLQYVEPGEVAYVIIEDPAEKARAEKEKQRAQGKSKNHGPWYGQVWSTVQAADAPAVAEEK